jgi:hypothetical protein
MYCQCSQFSGLTGITGSIEYICQMGPTGPAGMDGPTGPMGPIGPTGPIGFDTNSKTLITAYSTTEQVVHQGEPVIFDTHACLSGDCYHMENASEIWIWKSGYYVVYTSLYHLEACQFSLIKNNIAIVPASTIGSLYGSSQNTTTFIMKITDADIITQTNLSKIGVGCKLQLMNNTAFSPSITLYGSSSSGNPLPQITATISIFSI